MNYKLLIIARYNVGLPAGRGCAMTSQVVTCDSLPEAEQLRGQIIEEGVGVDIKVIRLYLST